MNPTAALACVACFWLWSRGVWFSSHCPFLSAFVSRLCKNTREPLYSDWVVSYTADPGAQVCKHLQLQWTLVIVNAWIVNNLSLVNIFGDLHWLFYNINYLLNSKHLSLVNKIGDKTKFTITRVHCILSKSPKESPRYYKWKDILTKETLK